MKKTIPLFIVIIILFSGISFIGIHYKSIIKTNSEITHQNLKNKNYDSNGAPFNSNDNNNNKTTQSPISDNQIINKNGCSTTQQVQYSLKKFTTKIICLKNGTTTCNKIEAICSVDVYNLDAKINATFKIKYSLISNKTQIDSGLASEKITANKYKTISIIFKDSGNFNTTKIRCLVNPKITPTTC